jgi:hypothetical protein
MGSEQFHQCASVHGVIHLIELLVSHFRMENQEKSCCDWHAQQHQELATNSASTRERRCSDLKASGTT